MSRKAVFSYFNAHDTFESKGGFVRFGDLLFSTALAVNQAAQYFSKVEMITTKWGADIFREIGLPATVITDDLEEVREKIHPAFWAYGKIVAYSLQKEPFIHIDNDVFLMEQLPERILRANLCFQSLEPFDKPGYSYYNKLKVPWEECPDRPNFVVRNEVTDFAYNCGICGGVYLDIFRQLRRMSEKYILSPRNHALLTFKYHDLMVHQNLFHEQYFLASLIKGYGLRSSVEVIAEDVQHIPEVMKYTHVWGTTKRSAKWMIAIRTTLSKLNPALYKRVNEFNMKNNI